MAQNVPFIYSMLVTPLRKIFSQHYSNYNQGTLA